MSPNFKDVCMVGARHKLASPRVSFSFVKKTFLWRIFSVIFKTVQSSIVDGKMKRGGREFDSRPGHKNFLCPGRAWFLLLPS